MLHLDLPTREKFSLLAKERADTCVSIYLNTTPVTQDVQASRIELKNFVKEAQTQLEDAAFDKGGWLRCWKRSMNCSMTMSSGGFRQTAWPSSPHRTA
jgi:hypothetical protein